MFKLFFFVLTTLLVGGVQSAEAASGMDFGDAMALIFGLVIGTVGILACLGKYARKQSATQFQ